MLSDIEIAQKAHMLPITEVAAKLGIGEEDIELYGRYKAKLSMDLIKRVQDKPDGKLILVTAITPTPAGEGKSTTTVGLAQGLAKIGQKVIVALREPSLGPCMGIKGGAAGGGYSQVVPMEDINLHFTGDFHAITSAHMLLAAMLDNHIQQGNALNIDPRRKADNPGNQGGGYSQGGGNQQPYQPQQGWQQGGRQQQGWQQPQQNFQQQGWQQPQPQQPQEGFSAPAEEGDDLPF